MFFFFLFKFFSFFLFLIFFNFSKCVLKKEAYITLIYGNHYDLAARVMFQSLKETGTKKDLILLVTPDIKENTIIKVIIKIKFYYIFIVSKYWY